MGNKGDKMTEDAVLSADEIVSRLEKIGGISSKKMFGGFGIFHDSKMFCLIDSKGKVFLRTNDLLKEDFAAHQSPQHSRMPYFEIPQVVLQDQAELERWVSKSLEGKK